MGIPIFDDSNLKNRKLESEALKSFNNSAVRHRSALAAASPNVSLTPFVSKVYVTD